MRPSSRASRDAAASSVLSDVSHPPFGTDGSATCISQVVSKSSNKNQKYEGKRQSLKSRQVEMGKRFFHVKMNRIKKASILTDPAFRMLSTGNNHQFSGRPPYRDRAADNARGGSILAHRDAMLR